MVSYGRVVGIRSFHYPLPPTPSSFLPSLPYNHRSGTYHPSLSPTYPSLPSLPTVGRVVGIIVWEGK